MDDLKVILAGPSDVLATLIQPQLARLLPGFPMKVVSNPADALPDVIEGRVVACLAYVSEQADEAQVVALLHEIESKRSAVPVFVILAEDDVYRRLRFFEWGAVDCLSWPVDLSRLAALIDVLSVRRRIEATSSIIRVDERSPAVHAPKRSKHRDSAQPVVAGFVFASRAMRELYDHIEAAADSDTNVLLTGETGTGKSHVSRAIHDLSPRRKRPFVVVECGGLSPTLLESELFGHVRGAFTGADRDHVGKFSVVEDGTILLDEIDCVPLEAQAKLLRVLEDRLFEPVGSNRVAKFRARVIAATNRPLDQLAAEGKFRSDLYFRLNVLEFRLPPLRDCREAIGPLAENFLQLYVGRPNRPVDEITFSALEAMMAYDWPGNIRELRNCIHRAVTLCRGPALDLGDLPDSIRNATARSGENVPADMQEFARSPQEPFRSGLESARQNGERSLILQLLAKHNNNRTRVAKELGISRVALYKKLHKLGLVEGVPT
ncbi:MAG: sigma-54 dependent transcriptional regulator [Pirellulaceae bacterium]|nr:sigma-54 dependent transcriptional regulator [Pirellulaceae bacterium]